MVTTLEVLKNGYRRQAAEQTIEMLIEAVRLGRLLVANGAFGKTGSCRPVAEVWRLERSSEVRKLSDQ